MVDLLLQDAVAQVRAHLHAGNYSDAFTLCQHILHFYPKHIETYTVLAQVCLATNDLAGANDVLRRVLSADPENIVALSGMGLISEVQDKYDEALWYIERAYEIQPSNDELRTELLRLRETYYGTTPSRIELTSGALARVYARQGQYAQAISEFRRLLRNDSKRYDARVGLAEALYRAGRTDEAAQVAQSVMADAPYALKPNLILGALWTENSVPEGQLYLQRANQLDPEHRVARDLLGEPFDGTQAPRLPATGESATLSDAARSDSGSIEQFELDGETARAVQFLSDMEREMELAPTTEEPLYADPDALPRVELQAQETPPGSDTLNSPAEGVTAQDTIYDSLFAPPTQTLPPSTEQVTAPSGPIEEIPAADSQKTSGEKSLPPQSKPASKFSERFARKSGEGLTADTIAAAAAALAASIALDKTSQPSPARRTHPALPKVRPVIRSAQEKLPGWLRLSATPSNAPASFDASTPPLLPSPIETKPEQERPDWLVQAEAVSAQENTPSQVDSSLPDWLNTPSSSRDTNYASEARQAQDAPAWFRDEPQGETPHVTQSAPAEPTEPKVVEVKSWLRDESVEELPSPNKLAQQPSTASMPKWLREEAQPPPTTPTPQQTVATPPPMSAVAEPPRTNQESVAKRETAPPPLAEPAMLIENISDVGPAPLVEERAPTQTLPDSATMLQMAREKRDSDDLKGALDLYERVMHRRPNYLDQVTADLQEIVLRGAAPTSANRLLGEAYAMVGRFKESLEQYRIAMGK